VRTQENVVQKFNTRPKTITPERPKAKATGKMYQSLADLAHLINTEEVEGNRHEQKGEDHYTAASIQQDELDQRQRAMIEAGTELLTNVANGRMESPKMDALPANDRKEVAEIAVEVVEADLAERKAARTPAAEEVNVMDMSFADRIKAVEAEVEADNAERISAGHVEASFTPPNVAFKEDLRVNDNLKEIIDAARKALDDAFESDRTCSQIEDHLFDAKEARAKWQRYAGAKLLVVKRRVKEDGGHWGDFVSEHFPFYSIRTVQWHIKRFLDEEGDEDTLDDLNPPKPQSVAEDYGREDWVMTDDGEAEADPMILEDTLEDRPVVAPVVLTGIAEAPEAVPANEAADDRNANDDCVTPPQPEPPKPADPTAAHRQQRHRDKLAEKRVANGGRPSRTRKSTERAALERDLVALMGDMDDDTLRGVLSFASRAVETKKAA
jgi:hypothetical protein